jgi:hypothetical protein
MVIFGISEIGTPWVHLLMDVSSNPYRDWISYQYTGDESPIEFHESPESPYCIGDIITAVDIHRRPVFLVWVTVNS